MQKISVLMAEDERALAHIVRENLEDREFTVVLCHDGDAALQAFAQKKPDILVLDVSMPGKDGFEVAKIIRAKDPQIPILFLTARTQGKDVVEGFEAGANDYLKKPFSIEELIVRIRVQVNGGRLSAQAIPAETGVFRLGGFIFDGSRNTLEYGIETVNLTSRESEVLRMLCSGQRRIVDRNVILREIWGSDSIFNARSLDVFITKLRKHLEGDPSVQIITVRGVGYKLVF